MLDLERLLEALLFVADGPIGLDELARALQSDQPTVLPVVQRLMGIWAERGLRIIYAGNKVQMVTAPEATPAIERLLGINPTSKLSPAALEVLAMVAYRQPITRAQIEAMRGVNSEAVLRALVARSLIAPVGRLEQAGRPVLYATTFEFLQYFCIASLEALPTLPELENYAPEATRPH